MSKFINKYFLNAVGLLIFVLTGISTELFGQSDSTRLMNTLEQLCTDQADGRKPGSAGHEWAKDFVVNQFEEIGLEPIRDNYLQIGGTDQEVDLYNIHGLVRGSGHRYILITSHYDHLGSEESDTYYGCDDNASGVAAMLEIARYFAKKRPEHSLIFISFDMEEQGLLGSKYWADHPPVPLDSVDLILNMDMVSKSDKNEIYASGAFHHPYLKKPIEDVGIDAQDVSVKFGHDRPISGPDDWTYASDHGPFFLKGVPHIYFGVEDHPYYHKPTDTFERTSFSFYWRVTNFLISTVDALDKYLTDE